MTAWQRDTLAPLYGLPLGIELTYIPGILESDGVRRVLRQPAGHALATPG